MEYWLQHPDDIWNVRGPFSSRAEARNFRENNRLNLYQVVQYSPESGVNRLEE